MSVAERIAAVRKRIAAAAIRSGRDPGEVRLVAVTKGHPPPVVSEAVAAGCRDIGENYVQELTAKMDALADPTVRWHLVGPLQRNKVKFVVGRIALLHTLDRPDLATEIEKRAAARGVTVEVLCEVNVAGEAQKAGVGPGELPALLEAASRCPHLAVRGLMTMPPLPERPEDARPFFRALRELRDRLRADYPGLGDLSMGMSGDFEVAIEEGATIVRIGTAIFGERPLGTMKERAG